VPPRSHAGSTAQHRRHHAAHYWKRGRTRHFEQGSRERKLCRVEIAYEAERFLRFFGPLQSLGSPHALSTEAT